MKSVIIIICCVLFPFATLQAQTRSEISKLSFVKDNISLGLASTAMKLHGIPVRKDTNMEFATGIGFQLRYCHTINFGRRFGMEFGLNGGAHKAQFETNAYRPTGFQLENVGLSEWVPHFEVFLRPAARIGIGEKDFLGLNLGPKIVRMTRDSTRFIIQNPNVAESILIENHWSPAYGLYLMFHGGASWQHMLPNGDLLQLSMEYTINGDATNALESDYYLSAPSKSVLGTFGWKGSYLSIGMGYTFGRIKELQRDLHRISSAQ